MTENIQFTHLHTHSPEGSLLDGFMRIKKAVSKVKESGMDALGISDHGTMAAHPKFNQICKEEGIHPVFGMEAYITYDKSFKKEDFTHVDFQVDDEGNHILKFLKEDESEEGYMSVLDFPTKKKQAEIERLAKKSYYPNLYRESFEDEAMIPEKKTVFNKGMNELVKSYKKKGYILHVKGDTSQRDFFEYFPWSGHLLLIAKNNEGYENLTRLNNIGNLEGFYGKPRIDYSDIKKYGKGIAATTACFLEGTPVLTENGIESIEDIQSKTNVLTHKGNWKPVEFRTTRDYTGNIFTFVTRGSTLNLTSTSDHKMLVFKEKKGNPSSEQKELRSVIRESLSDFILKSSAKNSARQMVPYGKAVWREAHELAPGDLLLTAIEDKVDSKKYIDISSFAMDKMKKPLKDYVLSITPELLELLGIYAAEGSFGEYFVTFTVDSRKENLIEFIVDSMSSIFGQEGTIYQKGNTNGVDIEFRSTELKNLFASWFGHGASNKRMPAFVRYLEPKLQMHFLKGLMYCDGHSRISGSLTAKTKPKTHNEVSVSTISKTLLYDLVHILHRNDLNPSVSNYDARVDKNGVSHKEWYSLNLYGNAAIRIHEFVFESKDLTLTMGDRLMRDIPLLLDGKRYMRQEIMRISSSPYEGPVYCLNVQGDHSFHAFGAAVHNCLGSIPSQLILKGKLEEAKEEIQRYVDAFDEVFLEIQPSRQEDQWIVNNQLIAWSKELNLPLIATTDAHMVDKDELELHEALTNIGQGSTNFQKDNSDISVYDSAYLMKPEEIISFGIPQEALQNAYDLSHRCHVTFLDDVTVKYPKYKIPEGYTFDSYLEELTWQGLMDLFLKKPHIKDYKKYQDRVRYELDIIRGKELSAYFIIVWDYVRYARSQNIYIGPGRGSAAGSLVALCLNITSTLDPIKYDLLFEREKVALVKFR